jgi:hypothetical protein
VAYEHTQSGWPVRLAFGLAALGFLVMSALQSSTGGIHVVGPIVGAVVTAALGLLWSRLTTRVDGQRLHWWFGPGWPRYSVLLADVASFELTRTTFWQGWGIRRMRRGWLYNIAGRDAVLLKRKDGRELLLGTDEPRRLKAALERAIPGSSRR